MPVYRNLLGVGNAKLGRDRAVHTWSIPAGGDGCPGSTPTCRSCCYALRHHYCRESVRDYLEANWAAARRPSFARRMVEEIRRRRVQLLRCHVSGDFFSAAYTAAWLEIASACPTVRLWWYSRSWRLPEVAPVLGALARLVNVRGWFSCDRETGIPSFIPPTVRLAWLMVSPDDLPPPGVSVVFRTYSLRRQPVGRIPLRLVCPTERPDPSDATCSSCKRCFTGPNLHPGESYKPGHSSDLAF